MKFHHHHWFLPRAPFICAGCIPGSSRNPALANLRGMVFLKMHTCVRLRDIDIDIRHDAHQKEILLVKVCSRWLPLWLLWRVSFNFCANEIKISPCNQPPRFGNVVVGSGSALAAAWGGRMVDVLIGESRGFDVFLIQTNNPFIDENWWKLSDCNDCNTYFLALWLVVSFHAKRWSTWIWRWFHPTHENHGCVCCSWVNYSSFTRSHPPKR